MEVGNEEFLSKKQRAREYYLKNKERISKERKEDRVNNPEKYKRRGVSYYEKNKEMISEKAKQKYQEEHEQRIEKQRKHSIENAERISLYRQSPNGRFSMIKSGAKRRNIDFGLTFEQYVNNFFGKECYLCGETGCSGIDRISSSIGYVDNNIKPCCFDCNEMKMDRTIEEFKERIIKLFNRIQEEKF